MRQFTIHHRYVPPAPTKAAQLFVVFGRSPQEQDMAQSAELIQVLARRFGQAVYLNVAVGTAEATGSPEKTSASARTNAAETINAAAPINPPQAAWIDFIQAQQAQYQVAPEATALIGIGEAGTGVLALTALSQPVAGRVVGFGARCDALPDAPMSLDQTIHLLHAGEDAQIPSEYSERAHLAIQQAQGDSTLDIIQGLSDSLDPTLMQQLVQRFETCIPLRIIQSLAEYSGE